MKLFSFIPAKLSRLGGVVAGLVGLALSITPAPAIAADAKVEKIAGGLHEPCAVAIRPGSGEPGDLFVAESGAGRVSKFSGGAEGQGVEIISGFAEQAAESGASQKKLDDSGVRSLFFLDHTRLVATGSDKGGKLFIQLFEVGDFDTKLKVDEAKQSVEIPDDDDAAKIRGLDGIARTQPNDKVADLLVAAATGESGPGGLWKVAIRANTLSDISPMFAKRPDDQGTVGGIAINSPGYITIAANANGESKGADTIRFLNPVDGRTIFQLATGLKQIVGLAYSPATGDLYAADRESGAIYRLDDVATPGKQTCKATKVAAIPRPTAMAFAANGTLFVTSDGSSSGDGALYRISGDL